MHNNTVRLLNMVNSLLDFSKLEASKIEVKRENLDINQLTQSIVSDFEPLMLAKNLHISTELPEAELKVKMDRYLYERILFNLLSNAGKFTPAGGQVSVDLRYSQDELMISVTDTGVGISEEGMKHLFQKFKQLEGSSVRRFEGSGLGLALVKEFCELLGGSVTVESEVGKGSSFEVRLFAPKIEEDAVIPAESQVPVHKRHFARPTVFTTTDLEQPPESKGENLPLILVAEDNPELSNYIQSLLKASCQVIQVADGNQALVCLETFQPDLILSDVMMPGLDGLTLCRKVKSNPKTAHIPFVLLTALTHREALLQGWEAGTDEYLFKPFHPTELMTRLKSMLAAVEARRQSEKIIQEYNLQLEFANKELEAFTYTVSHDLRAPIRSISGFSSILLERFTEQLPPDAFRYVNMIQEDAAHGSQLIEGLLHFSKLSRQPLRKEEIDTNELVLGIWESLAKDQSGRMLEFKKDHLPASYGDPLLLGQVWINLLSNALKYTRSRENAVIEVGYLDHQPGVFYVRDNGIGFDTNYAAKLFGVFQRLHSNESYEGTGVGLAIVQRIVHRHGGRIWAEAEENVGACFFFILGE